MALDIYVMPLWRFKAGDFRSPIETAMGRCPKVVTPDGIAEQPPAPGWLRRWRCRRQVAAIRKAVQDANGVPIRWHDEGGVVHSAQSSGIEPLRAYAQWLDGRDQLPEFGPPPENNYYKHPAWELKTPNLSCPHLVQHSCYSGYFLPCEFSQLVTVEPYVVFDHWRFERAVGSSPRLLRELDFLQQHLHLPDNYNYSGTDPLLPVRRAYIELRKPAELSCEHGLPIIFCG